MEHHSVALSEEARADENVTERTHLLARRKNVDGGEVADSRNTRTDP